jgi:hypothetical protein
MEIPFDEYKDRQLTINFSEQIEEEIAEILDKEDSYQDYDEDNDD